MVPAQFRFDETFRGRKHCDSVCINGGGRVKLLQPLPKVFLICFLVLHLLPSAQLQTGIRWQAKTWPTASHEPIERQTHAAVRLRGQRQDFVSLRVRHHLNVPMDDIEVEEDWAKDGNNGVQREWLIHLKGPIHRDLRVKLAGALGVKENALKYVPSNTFLVSSTHMRVQDAKAAVPDVIWAGHVLPHHKVSPELHNSILNDFLPANPPQTSTRRRILSSEGDALELAVVLSPHAHHLAADTAAQWAERLGCVLSLAESREEKTNKKHQWIRVASPKKLILRYSVYLLYWYKSTNTDKAQTASRRRA
jgi:hypothetical protein